MLNQSFFRRLAALVPAAGLFLSLIPPAAALSGAQTGGTAGAVAVSAPVHPAGRYIITANLLTASGLELGQVNALWNRDAAGLAAKALRGSFSPEDLIYPAIPYSRVELTDRYAAYSRRFPSLTAAGVVKTVNMGLDRPFYQQPAAAENPDSTGVLVNKYHALSPNYVPELEVLGNKYGTGSLRPEAAAQFRAMADAARADGLKLRSVSAYRSYQRQNTLYTQYLATDSQASVDRYSARPGYSEHQTGLAVDINAASTSAKFQNTPEYAWLTAHCAEYGFLLRYPKGKESITGYKYEPWHYRYVGREIAEFCMAKGLTYEEYLATQPASEANLLPGLVFRGQTADLSGEAILLNGSHYLPAPALVHALGGSAESAPDGSLILRLGSRSVSLRAGRTYLCAGQAHSLSSAALPLHGTLYLTLTDLCLALGLGARHGTDSVSLFPLYES